MIGCCYVCFLASLETNGNNVKLNTESDGPFKGFSYVPANFDFKDMTNDEVFVDVEVKSWLLS